MFPPIFNFSFIKCMEEILAISECVENLSTHENTHIAHTLAFL